jgi:hypothetical protein
MADLKPIETYYNGYRFRSRLEARWAVFFDALGVKYEYEPEGFFLPSGKMYLPDFRVKCYGKRGEIHKTPFDLYIEVKGFMTQEDAEKINEFANVHVHTEDEFFGWYEPENPILIVTNIPQRNCSWDADALSAYEGMNGTDICPFNYQLIDGDYFAAYPAGYDGKFYLWGDDSNYIDEVEIVERAYDKARQARFEHGETP